MVVSRAHFQRSSILDYAKHHHKENYNKQRKRHHHPHALQVAPLDLLIIRLKVPLAVLRTLTDRP